MDLKEIELRRSAADEYSRAKGLVETAKAAERSMSPDEIATYDQHVARGDDLKRQADVFGRDSFTVPEPTTGNEPEPERSMTFARAAEDFVHSKAVEKFRDNGFSGREGMKFDGLSLRALIDNQVSSGGAFQNPARVPITPLAVPDRTLHLIDLLPHGTTTDNSVEYVQDTTSSVAGDTAVEVAEGSAKPETTETFQVVTDPVRTIAAWVNMTRQAAADNVQLDSYLRERLVYRIRRRLDNQIINGDGTGVNLLGIANRAGILTLAPGTAEDRAITARKAVTLLEQNEQEANVIVVNPADLEKFDLYQATTKEFIKGEGYGRVTGTLWGLTPVWSNAITAGTAIVMDTQAAMVWDRQDPALYLTDSHASNFTSNILTLLAELRAALSLFQPKGVCKVTFNGTV